MQPSAEFVSEVETHLDQALLEGWVSAKNTAAVLAVGIGVLLTHVEAMDPNAARLVRRLLLTAVGAV